MSVSSRSSVNGSDVLLSDINALRSGARLGERLIERGLLTSDQLARALDAQAKSFNYLGETLINLGYVPAGQIGALLEEMCGTPYVDLSTYPIDFAAARLLPEEMVRQRLILPVRADDEQVWLAMEDPFDLETIDGVREQTGRRVVPMLALLTQLLPVINRCYNKHEIRITVPARPGVLIEPLILEEPAASPVVAQNVSNAFEQNPLSLLANNLVDGLFLNHASDVHLEPQADGLRVRYRVNGEMHEQTVGPGAWQAALLIISSTPADS